MKAKQPKNTTLAAAIAAEDTAFLLIRQSIAKTEIARARWSEDLHADLLIECEDSCDVGDHIDYWGVDEGSEWRVVLSRSIEEGGA